MKFGARLGVGALLATVVCGSGCGGDVQVVPIGQPCTPAEERDPAFAGFSKTDVTIETNAPDCNSGVCVVANFQGRTTCPYGQLAEKGGASVDPNTPLSERCRTPAPESELVTVPVPPQNECRPPDAAVYCTCRCDGADKTKSYCTCPSGFTCEPIAPDLFGSGADVAGSYCVKVVRPNPDLSACTACLRPAAPRSQGGCGLP